MKANELKKIIERLQSNVDDFGFMLSIHDHNGVEKKYKISGVTDLYQIAKKKEFYLNLIIGSEVKG